MCNKLHLKIKSVCSCGQTYGFVPCGKCVDCRNVTRSSWVFRLRVELDELCNKGWKIGFFTLTYNDDCLPYIPYCLFDGVAAQIPSFKKDDIRGFFVKLKKWIYNQYGCCKRVDKKTKEIIEDNRLRYMCCAEFGEHTKRPHYHGIVCFPPCVPAQEIFDKIHEFWTFGFVFPRDFNGGHDSHGYLHRPFICDSVKAASVYAAKYVCKDIAYLDFVKDLKLRKRFNIYRSEVGIETYGVEVSNPDGSLYAVERDARLIRKVHFEDGVFRVIRLSDYMPFHFQSRSLGLKWLESKTDAQKLDYILRGYHFVGDDSFSLLPVYLKNKIIFSPRYVYENGKRLVRRDSTAFFRNNCREIFEAKVEKLEEVVKKFVSSDFWRSVGATDEEVSLLFCAYGDTKALTSDYLAYFGVPYKECYYIQPWLQWYRRYDENCVDVTNCPRISYEYYNYVHSFFIAAFNLYNKYDLKICEDKLKEERELNRINDFFKSQT